MDNYFFNILERLKRSRSNNLLLKSSLIEKERRKEQETMIKSQEVDDTKNRGSSRVLEGR